MHKDRAVNARGVPLAIREAIDRGSCTSLPDRDGYFVVTEITPAPCCKVMSGLYIVRQVMPTLEFTVHCFACAGGS